MFLNDARNHHFVSQAEQRLNAVNPGADARNQRILIFDVTDRDTPVLKLRDPRGTRIATSLAAPDLFSFEVVDSRHRKNLEGVFGRYESQAAQRSEALVDKLRAGCDDIKAEVIDVFAIKLLNFFRNPYCVRKALNTFGPAANYEPTDPELKTAYRAVLEGSKPHLGQICKTFNLTPEIYERWLRALFVILAPVPPMNAFEASIKTLFEQNFVSVNVFNYTNSNESDICLLSDRGFNVLKEDDNAFMFEFNLGRRSFGCFYLSSLDEYEAKAEMIGRVNTCYSENNVPVLVAYNQRTAFQCASSVLAAVPSPRVSM